MQQSLLQLFNQYPHLAIVISICASVLIAVIGILPSVFVTAANILFFGFVNGTLISFAGEAIGAAIAFLLYRKGFKKAAGHGMQKYPKVKRLVDAENKEASYLVFSLRLIPFVPSGLITFAAAVGKVSFWIFFIASTLGKLPALLLEAYSVYEVTQFGWLGKMILGVTAVIIIYLVVQRMMRSKGV